MPFVYVYMKIISLRKFIYTGKTFVIILLFFYKTLYSQSCSYGERVFIEDFGSGTSRLGPSLNQDPNLDVHPNFRPAIFYTHIGTGTIREDQYGIMKNPKDVAPGGASWTDSFSDHTGNSNGYLYYCDAKQVFNVFYAQKINGLCNNIQYEFSAWFAKANGPNYFTDPNIKLIVGFTDITDSNIGSINETITGDIEGIGVNRWQQRSLIFTPPTGTKTIYFMLKNNVSGITGNDIVIDDIEIKPCGPLIDIFDENSVLIDYDNPICITDLNNKNISLSSNVRNSFSLQWQESLGNGVWTDIIKETTNTLNHTLPANLSSTYSIRLKFAKNLNNLVSTGCHFFSKEVTFVQSYFEPLNNLEICDNSNDGDSANGIANFNLESQTSIISGNTPSLYDISYHLSKTDAISGLNPLSSPHENILSPYSQTIYVRILDKNTNCLNTELSFNLIVNPLPEFTVSNQSICKSNPSVELDPIELNSNELFIYAWAWSSLDNSVINQLLPDTSPTLTVSNPGTYSVTLTKTDSTNCSNTKNFIVNTSSEEGTTITHNDITITDLSKNNSVSINPNALDTGKDYQFALKEENESDIFITYQGSSSFNNVKPGFYTLYVKNDDCNISTLNISVIGYPSFFTPNNDGMNDFWKIQGIGTKNQSKSIIQIFNRYGKLIKQISAKSEGWDGSLNGTKLPTDDYWFKTQLEDGRNFTGHFTLKY